MQPKPGYLLVLAQMSGAALQYCEHSVEAPLMLFGEPESLGEIELLSW